MVTCKTCGKVCKNEHGLKTHRRMVHPPERVAEKKAACPRCGCTDLAVKSGAQVTVLEVSGTAADGRFYNRVVWRRKACRACGQVATVRSLEYEPEKGSSNSNL